MGADIKPGDRVKVTFEGTWDEENGAGVALTAGVKLYEGYTLDAAKSIEKIELPVEVFKPGDVVRDKFCGDIRALARDGWVNLTTGRWYPGDISGEFTSEAYERVNLDSPA